MEIAGHRPSTGLAIIVAGGVGVAAATTSVGRVRTRNEFGIAAVAALGGVAAGYQGATSLDDNLGLAARPVGVALGVGTSYGLIKAVRAAEIHGVPNPRIAGVLVGLAMTPAIGTVLSAITHHSSD